MLPDLTGRPRWYVLDGHTPVAVSSVVAWAEWFSHHPRAAHVAASHVGPITVTTRFTGIDRAVMDHSPPTLFETVATDDATTLSLGSAATWAEAIERHSSAVRSLETVAPTPAAAINQEWLGKAWFALRRAVMSRTASFFPRT